MSTRVDVAIADDRARSRRTRSSSTPSPAPSARFADELCARLPEGRDRHRHRRHRGPAAPGALSPTRCARAAGASPRSSCPTARARSRWPRAEELCESFAREGLDRGALVVALGGGVVGDLGRLRRVDLPARRRPTCRCRRRCWRRSTRRWAARPASTCRRARTWSAASASRGWSTPTSRTLATLSERDRAAGLAEVVKHALIADAALLERLEAQRRGGARRASRRCSPSWWRARAPSRRASSAATSARPTRRRRALLNFGHTVGHALEAASRAQRRARCATARRSALGMLAAARVQRGVGRRPTSSRASPRCSPRLGLPIDLDRRLHARGAGPRRRRQEARRRPHPLRRRRRAGAGAPVAAGRDAHPRNLARGTNGDDTIYAGGRCMKVALLLLAAVAVGAGRLHRRTTCRCPIVQMQAVTRDDHVRRHRRRPAPAPSGVDRGLLDVSLVDDARATSPCRSCATTSCRCMQRRRVQRDPAARRQRRADRRRRRRADAAVGAAVVLLRRRRRPARSGRASTPMFVEVLPAAAARSLAGMIPAPTGVYRPSSPSIRPVGMRAERSGHRRPDLASRSTCAAAA